MTTDDISFVDRLQRRWLLEIDGSMLAALRECGLDLAKLTAYPAGDVVDAMLSDATRAEAILWAICRDQAAAQKIDRVSFARGLNADALCSATDGVIAAVSHYEFIRRLKVELEAEELRRIGEELAALQAKG